MTSASQRHPTSPQSEYHDVHHSERIVSAYKKQFVYALQFYIRELDALISPLPPSFTLSPKFGPLALSISQKGNKKTITYDLNMNRTSNLFSMDFELHPPYNTTTALYPISETCNMKTMEANSTETKRSHESIGTDSKGILNSHSEDDALIPESIEVDFHIDATTTALAPVLATSDTKTIKVDSDGLIPGSLEQSMDRKKRILDSSEGDVLIPESLFRESDNVSDQESHHIIKDQVTDSPTECDLADAKKTKKVKKERKKEKKKRKEEKKAQNLEKTKDLFENPYSVSTPECSIDKSLTIVSPSETSHSNDTHQNHTATPQTVTPDRSIISFKKISDAVESFIDFFIRTLERRLDKCRVHIYNKVSYTLDEDIIEAYESVTVDDWFHHTLATDT